LRKKADLLAYLSKPKSMIDNCKQLIPFITNLIDLGSDIWFYSRVISSNIILTIVLGASILISPIITIHRRIKMTDREIDKLFEGTG